jgi:SAM-dependent methyltransferase
MHPDIIEIVQGLQNYFITITTNCSGPFYKDPDFAKKLKPHKSSRLRINTTYHPHYIEPEEYLRVIAQFRGNQSYVDQTSYVYHPEIDRYMNKIDRVSRRVQVDYAPYLGFYNQSEGFAASFHPINLEPTADFHFEDAVSKRCGITDLDVYAEMCGQYIGHEVECEHPFRSFIIGPNGNHYHCHYKLYYDIDPACNIRDFKPVDESSKNCRHYGFCNWCDIPRVHCKRNNTAKPLILNKLYDKAEEDRSEIQHLINKMGKFAGQYDLEFNRLKWFEYAYFLLYSGHRHRCKTLDVGSAKSVLPYYLAEEGYAVTTIDVEDYLYQAQRGQEFGTRSLQGDIREQDPTLIEQFDFIICSSVIEHIDRDTEAVKNLALYLRPGGVLCLSTDFYPEHIEYPDANRKIVLDRPTDSHTDSRVYSVQTFTERIIEPLKLIGLEVLGETDYSNVDIYDSSTRAVRDLYTFGIGMFRKRLQ